MWKKVILAALLSFVGLYALFEVGYYTTSIPSFCGWCHEVEPYVASWEESPHKDVNCQICHRPAGELGKFHSKARGLNYVFQHFSGEYTIPTQAQIFEQSCIRCHLGDNKDFPNITEMTNTPKVNHYEIIKNSQSCLECHRTTGHDVDIYLTPDLEKAKQ